MKKDPIFYVKDILRSILLLEKYMHNVTWEIFKVSEEKQDLAARRIEIIGEAAKNIPEELRKKYPDTAWKGMAGIRDMLIHHYDEVDWKIIWDTIHDYIPPLKIQLEEILKKEAK